MLYKCGAPIVIETGDQIGECEHTTDEEGRYCVCCELKAGMETSFEAARQRIIQTEALAFLVDLRDALIKPGGHE